MIFQWYLFALILFVYFFSISTGQRYVANVYGQKEILYSWKAALILLLPMIYCAATRGTLALHWSDTSAYQGMFQNFPSSVSELGSYITEDTKDKGFVVVSVLLKSIIGDHVVLYFGIIATFTLFCVFSVYRKYSCNLLVSIFLFLAAGDYLQWEYNGIRQFIAVAMIFASTGLLLRRKYKEVIVIILLASLIHMSALIMIPMLFVVSGRPWNKRTLLFLATVFVAVIFVDQFTNLITEFMGSTQYSNEIQQFEDTQGTNMLRVAVFSIPAIISFLFRREIVRANNKLIDLCVNMSIATMGCYLISAFTSGIFMGRLCIYFSLYNYILLPWELKHLFEKQSAKAVHIVMLAVYMVFYYYQVHVVWGI